MADEQLEAICKAIAAYMEAARIQRGELEAFWRTNQIGTLAVHPVTIDGMAESLDLVDEQGQIIGKVKLTIDIVRQGFVELSVVPNHGVFEGNNADSFEIVGRQGKIIGTVERTPSLRKYGLVHIALAEWIVEGIEKAGYEISNKP